MKQGSRGEETKQNRRYGLHLFHEGDLGRCPDCGRLIILPCLACRMERFVPKRPKKSVDLEEDGSLQIMLRNSGERHRYEKIRKYREQYHVPMYPEIETEPQESCEYF